jgi:hypothetical protein
LCSVISGTRGHLGELPQADDGHRA